MTTVAYSLYSAISIPNPRTFLRHPFGSSIRRESGSTPSVTAGETTPPWGQVRGHIAEEVVALEILSGLYVKDASAAVAIAQSELDCLLATVEPINRVDRYNQTRR